MERARRLIMSWLHRLLLVLAIGVTVSALAAPAGAQDPVIAAAGDIACDPADPATSDTCHQQATSDLLVGAGLAAVLPLGDIQYNSASYDNILDRAVGPQPRLRALCAAGQKRQPRPDR